MYKSMLTRFFLLSTIFIIVSDCAKVSAPRGGPKDKQPPVVVKSVPEYGAKNFKGKSVVITFNKYVVLDNISEKFMVSPPMKKKPRILIKGKSVNIEYNEELKDSTTYTFYFQDAIKDLNEGNILDNYQFVFSTGPVVDSLSVTGNVYNSFNLEIPEKALVLLYHELADSAVIKHLPDYISTVDQKGYFRINNVRAGNYKLYALIDADNSKNYNLPDEEFAFLDSSVVITPEKNFIPVVKDTTALKKGLTKGTSPSDKDVSESKKSKGAASADKSNSSPKKKSDKDKSSAKDTIFIKGEYQLILFTAQKKNHYLAKSSRDSKYRLIYSLSLPPESMKFDFSIPGTENDKYFLERSKNLDTLKVWLADSALYSKSQITTIVKFPFTDSLGILGYKQDTIQMRYTPPRAPRVAKAKKHELKLENNIHNSLLKPGQSIVFSALTPFNQPDTSRIRLYELIESNRQRIPFYFAKDSTNSCRYILKTKLLQEKKYLLVADSGSFCNIYNDHSDSIGIKFSIRSPDSYGKLTLNLKNYEGGMIIQLLDKTEKLVAETYMKKAGKVVFPLLENGLYRVRVIYDLNGDGKWTTGDFTLGRQPEPVSYYPGELEMKTDWDLDQPWDVGLQNYKNQKLRETKKTK